MGDIQVPGTKRGGKTISWVELSLPTFLCVCLVSKTELLVRSCGGGDGPVVGLAVPVLPVLQVSTELAGQQFCVCGCIRLTWSLVQLLGPLTCFWQGAWSLQTAMACVHAGRCGGGPLGAWITVPKMLASVDPTLQGPLLRELGC